MEHQPCSRRWLLHPHSLWPRRLQSIPVCPSLWQQRRDLCTWRRRRRTAVLEAHSRHRPPCDPRPSTTPCQSRYLPLPQWSVPDRQHRQSCYRRLHIPAQFSSLLHGQRRHDGPIRYTSCLHLGFEICQNSDLCATLHNALCCPQGSWPSTPSTVD